MISKAEWEVMRIVWANGSVTSREITSSLCSKKAWSISTTKTLIRRLVDKEWLLANKKKHYFVYQALVTPEEAQEQAVKGFSEQFCARAIPTIISQLLETTALSQDELEEIETLLIQQKKEAPLKATCSCYQGQCICQPLKGGK